MELLKRQTFIYKDELLWNYWKSHVESVDNLLFSFTKQIAKDSKLVCQTVQLAELFESKLGESLLVLTKQRLPTTKPEILLKSVGPKIATDLVQNSHR